jgi:multidrug resistance efflux pump
MESQARIPIPFRQRWRQFKVAYLPVFTFVALLGAIAWMWNQYVHPAAIVGEVEPIRANILSLLPGTIEQLRVGPLQAVTNGQELVTVAVMEPEVLNAELAAIEADLRLMKARMDLDKTRNLNAASQLRASLLTEKASLAIAQVRLQQAEGEFERVTRLFQEGLVGKGIDLAAQNAGARNDFGYDVALRDRDALRAEVEDRGRIVAQLAKDLEQLEATGIVQVSPADAAVENAIKAQRERMQRLQRTVVLRSPLDGFVSVINHRPGANVTAGMPLLVVSANKSDRIIAWVRQPVSLRPRVGDLVEVRRNALGQSAAEATIIEVGSQLEPISPVLLSPSQNARRAEVGLPLVVRAPAVLDLIPGEAVTLYLKSRKVR